MPRPTGPAVAIAAAPVEAELEAAAEELAAALLDEDSEESEVSEDEAVLVVVPVVWEDESEVLVPVAEEELAAVPLETVDKVVWVAPGPATGEVRPAGMDAAGCCEVTASAWLVTTEGWEVTASGWPVTTPRELVWVRYWVAGFSTVSTVC